MKLYVLDNKKKRTQENGADKVITVDDEKGNRLLGMKNSYYQRVEEAVEKPKPAREVKEEATEAETKPTGKDKSGPKE